MQTVNAALLAELNKGQTEPRILVDLYEFYASSYLPGVNGFDPADAIESFAGQEITWNGIAYRREVINRGDILRSMGAKTNSVTITFSNISRYLATLAQSQTIEGMFLVIRCVSPTVVDDSLVLFVGRCEKPSDIDKEQFSLSARQDFGNINQTLPPRSFTAQDPDGRLPSDPLFEGINFIAQVGSVTYYVVVPESGFFGRLFGRHDLQAVTAQSSSVDGTPYGSPLPEIFGRCQMPGIPFIWKDHGLHIGACWAISNGPIDAMSNIKVRTPNWGDLINSFETPPDPPLIHLGLAGTANVQCLQFPGAGYLSHLAYIDAASTGTTFEQIDNPPEITAIVRGRVVPLPDGTGSYTLEGWTDNPTHIARFLLTHDKFVNINPAFMEDSINVLTAEHCDVPLIDESTDQVIRVIATDAAHADRYQSTGIYNPDYVKYYDLETSPNPPEFLLIHDENPDFYPIDPDYDNPFTPVYQRVLRKRYTFNAPITAEVRAVDYLYKTVFPSFKGFIRVNKRGKYEIRSEQPSDQTFLRSATAIGATTLPVQDVTPWKTGPDLLQGRLMVGFNITTSEVRHVSSAAYSADGNSITLSVSKTGAVTILASGATLTGGSSSVQASGTITIGGSPAAGDTVTATINGWPIEYTVAETETTGTVARMLCYHINATPRIAKYLKAEWVVGSPTIITLKALYGVLTLDSQLLKAHTGPVADPSSAPTLAASGLGTLSAGTYKVAYADVGALGQTATTPIASIVLTANQKIDVSSLPAFPAGITSRNFYVSEEAGSSNLRFFVNRVNASDFSINALPAPGASLPPTHNRTAEELIRVAMSFSTNSQDIYPAWPPSTAVTLNDIYLPTIPNGHKYQVTTAGTTTATEPVWPTAPGGTVGNGTAIFTEVGATYLGQSGLTRANIKKKGIKWPQGSRQSSVNQIKINYRSARDDFALVPYRVNDPVHQAQVKKIYPLEIDGSGIDSFHQMYRIANWALAKHREGDWFFSIDTGPGALPLEEGDVICASDDSGGLVNVAARIEELRIHANHDVTIHQARKYSTNMFSDDVTADTIPIASTLRPAGLLNSHVEFIDTAPIRDSDSVVPGFYVAVSRPLTGSGDWRGWALWVDFGDGYVRLVRGDLAAISGTSTTILGGVTDPDVFDITNTGTFTVQYGARPLGLASATQAELDANPLRNLFLWGNEYIQAATVTDNGLDSYTLSNLYRGRFHSAGKTVHFSGERVVYMNGAEVFVPMSSNRRLLPYNYKAVTTNQDVADAAPVSFTWSGGTYRPAAPRGIVIYKDAYASGSSSAGQIQTVIPKTKRIHNEISRYAQDVYKSTPDGTFTVDASTDIFTATSHGMSNGEVPALSSTGELPSPIKKEWHVYVRDATTHTFKLARLEGGTAINITDTGTGTHSFSKRLRHMPIIQGVTNPVVVDDGVSTITTPGSGGWLQTVKSAYFGGNDIGHILNTNFDNLAVFGNITESGFFTEFSINLAPKSGMVVAMSFVPLGSVDMNTAFYQMHFTLVTTLPAKFGTTARRWQLRIKESETGASPATVFTETDYELPETRYRMQISGSEVRYYRDYTGPGSELIYKSTIPATFPMAVHGDTTLFGYFLNVQVGGRADYVTTYPALDQIADTDTTPPPTTFRYRVYEEREFQNVIYQGDATDFIT